MSNLSTEEFRKLMSWKRLGKKSEECCGKEQSGHHLHEFGFIKNFKSTADNHEDRCL